MRKRLALICVLLTLLGCGDKTTRYTNTPGLFVAGTAFYEKPGVNGTRLSPFTSRTPITCAAVQIINPADNNRVIVLGQTDENGEYKIDIPLELATTPLNVRILAKSADTKLPFVVRRHDNSIISAGETYSVDSDPFVGKTVGLTVVATRSSGLAGAFNIYEFTNKGFKFVQEKAEPNTKFPSLLIHWAKDEDGIGCTCFLNGIFRPHRINIRGMSDPEEFDDSVILHELGHYMHESFSDTDSPGGFHSVSCSTNQVIDPRLAWSEGWATGFGQMVLGDRRYIDTHPNGGFILDIEYPCSVQQGPYSEIVISAMYWDLFDGSDSGVPTRDGDTMNLTFNQIWTAMKDISASGATVKDFYLSLRRKGFITTDQWNQNFLQLGIDEVAILSVP